MERIEIFTRAEWRAWLAKNHDKQTKVAVVIHKKHTGKPSISHREFIEEAICFGWIDTTVKSLDEDTFLRNFSKRNENSKWSDNTLGYAKDLIKRKLMAPAGLIAYKHGLQRPTHDHGIPKNPDPPQELLVALEKNKKAKEGFAAFSPSVRRMYLRWLLQAKLSETRAKRIKKIVQLSVARNAKGLYPKGMRGKKS